MMGQVLCCVLGKRVVVGGYPRQRVGFVKLQETCKTYLSNSLVGMSFLDAVVSSFAIQDLF
jgi:predicted aspartyl protease